MRARDASATARLQGRGGAGGSGGGVDGLDKVAHVEPLWAPVNHACLPPPSTANAWSQSPLDRAKEAPKVPLPGVRTVGCFGHLVSAECRPNLRPKNTQLAEDLPLSGASASAEIIILWPKAE